MHLVGQLLHAPGELLLHVLALPGEEAAGVLDQPVIPGLVDAADAGGAAALDLVEQARPRPALEHAVAAGAQQEGALERDQRAVDRAGRGEGAEIIAGRAARPAMLGDLREVVIAGEMDVGERLVVPERHVVARRQALDQVVLEQQRLDLGVRDHHLHRARLRHHAAQAVREVGGVDVVGDAALEAPRLADIESVALGVEHAVDARALRQGARDVADQRRAARQPALRRHGFLLDYGVVALRHLHHLAQRRGDVNVADPACLAQKGRAYRPLVGYPRRLWTNVLKTSRRSGPMGVKSAVSALCLKFAQNCQYTEIAVFFSCQV